MKMNYLTLYLFLILLISGCTNQNELHLNIIDPNSAPKVKVDRFNEAAGNLMKRSLNPALPGENEAIDFDQEPFVTQSFGPDGQVVRYYNFDIQPLKPAPIYVFFKSADNKPVENQLNIIDVIPGDAGYNDFWQVYKVTVPDSYEANSITSLQDILIFGFPITETDILVNCPVVPEGSIARERYNSTDTLLHRGWYNHKIVYYFTFSERALKTTIAGSVPLSPIYVTFNINPSNSDPLSGPPSGFMVETGTKQTHNVIATIPEEDDYSPLWIVEIYDNKDFSYVKDLDSAKNSGILATSVANVNCPVVYVEPEIETKR